MFIEPQRKDLKSTNKLHLMFSFYALAWTTRVKTLKKFWDRFWVRHSIEVSIPLEHPIHDSSLTGAVTTLDFYDFSPVSLVSLNFGWYISIFISSKFLPHTQNLFFFICVTPKKLWIAQYRIIRHFFSFYEHNNFFIFYLTFLTPCYCM